MAKTSARHLYALALGSNRALSARMTPVRLLDEAVRREIACALERNPARARGSAHHYDLSDFGLDRDELARRFSGRSGPV